VKESSINQRDRWKPALGAALAIFCGLLLWATALGEPWLHASYDYLFRFGSHTVTNDVVLVLMDNDSFDHFRQDRAEPWDRALHVRLLDRLADDGCAVTVIDAFFRNPRDPDKDARLIRAMERQRRLVLMAERAQVHHPELSADYPVLPAKPFLEAANGRWGVAWLEPELDRIVRRHWPPVSPGHYPTLPESVARAAAIRFNDVPQPKWLRYYGRHGAWPRMGYRFALDRPPGYFRNKIVFIGTQPATPLPNEEKDEFSTPYTRWTGEATGGAEILLTAFLNLANDDWLRRAPAAAEAAFIALVGALIGAGCWLFEGRRLPMNTINSKIL
jgi:adenylate cyclase